MSAEEAEQIAAIALWEAWRRDPACGKGFSALVETVVRRRLTNWIRREVPVVRGSGGGDGGPPAMVVSLDALGKGDLEQRLDRVRFPWGGGVTVDADLVGMGREGDADEVDSGAW